MEIIISLVLKFFGDIFSNVINEQLTTMGETYDVENEKGIIEIDVQLDDLLDQFSGI